MATTTNYGWATPDDTDLVKDGAAAIRTLGSSIDTSFVADEGDLLVGGTSDIFEALPIGAAGTVLTSDGDTAEWAAPSGGGNLTISQVASGTTTSGSSLSLSSLSSYDQIKVLFTGIDPSAAQSLRFRINGNSAGSYVYNYIAQKGSTTTGGSSSTDDAFYLTDSAVEWSATSTANQVQVDLTNCKATGFTFYSAQFKYVDSGSASVIVSTRGVYKVAEAVSSCNFEWASGATFQAGTYTVWAG
jgi:hypothetical protein